MSAGAFNIRCEAFLADRHLHFLRQARPERATHIWTPLIYLDVFWLFCPAREAAVELPRIELCDGRAEKKDERSKLSVKSCRTCTRMSRSTRQKLNRERVTDRPPSPPLGAHNKRSK